MLIGPDNFAAVAAFVAVVVAAEAAVGVGGEQVGFVGFAAVAQDAADEIAYSAGHEQLEVEQSVEG